MTSSSGRPCLQVEDIGQVTAVRFTEPEIMDAQQAESIAEQLFGLVDERRRKKLLLNLHNVEYLSSTALGKLVALRKKLQTAGGRLVLCGLDPQVYEVLAITSLDRQFVIRYDEQEALADFK